MKQHTIKESFSLSSVGLHTGLQITATFNPAPENTGIRLPLSWSAVNGRSVPWSMP